MLTRSTHISLLNQLREGIDPAAWREFEHRYGDLIRNVALRRGLQPADCDDVLQDVMMALTRSMPQFEYDPERGSFRGYLKTITGHVIFRRLRQNDRPRALTDSEAVNVAVAPGSDDSHLEALWESEWRQYHLRLAMRTIEAEFNEMDRIAFAHYAVEGQAANETAEQLGMSVDQVYQAKSRILRRLSQLIEQQVREEG
jgi:RNA polymerase sigma factor (sigma-70 family)